jgi:uncharacterized protein
MSEAQVTHGLDTRAGATVSAAYPSLRALAIVYCVLIVAAEAAGAVLGGVATAVLDAVVLVVLIDHFVIGSATERATRLLPALALVPLLRLASLALAVRSPLVSCCAAGVPILLATALVTRELGLAPLLRVSDLRRPAQWAPALAAIPVGAIGVVLFGSHALQRDPSPALVLAGCLVVFIFAGLLEELVFRGVIQRALEPLGTSCVILANVLFSATYLASGSLGTVLAVAAAGGMAGWWTRRTGSVAGAALAHGVLAAGYLVLWPALLG